MSSIPPTTTKGSGESSIALILMCWTMRASRTNRGLVIREERQTVNSADQIQEIFRNL